MKRLWRHELTWQFYYVNAGNLRNAGDGTGLSEPEGGDGKTQIKNLVGKTIKGTMYKISQMLPGERKTDQQEPL